MQRECACKHATTIANVFISVEEEGEYEEEAPVEEE